MESKSNFALLKKHITSISAKLYWAWMTRIQLNKLVDIKYVRRDKFVSLHDVLIAAGRKGFYPQQDPLSHLIHTKFETHPTSQPVDIGRNLSNGKATTDFHVLPRSRIHRATCLPSPVLICLHGMVFDWTMDNGHLREVPEETLWVFIKSLLWATLCSSESSTSEVEKMRLLKAVAARKIIS
jgi:hypothetical protein